MILKRQDLLNEAGELAHPEALAALAHAGAARHLDPSQWAKPAYTMQETKAGLDPEYREDFTKPIEGNMPTTTLPNPNPFMGNQNNGPASPATNIFNPAGTVAVAPTPVITPVAVAPRLQTQAASPDSGRRLVVGAGIALGGEISTCDVLVIEGAVQASLKDCKQIEIAQGGLFKGNAEIDNALIAGNYEGNLVVRGLLHLAPTAKFQGSVRYNQLVVEAGAEINGEMQSLQSQAQAPAPRAAANGGKAARNTAAAGFYSA